MIYRLKHNTLASDVVDMTMRSWPLADVITVICLWPIITQEHGGFLWREGVTGPWSQLVDFTRVLKTPSEMRKCLFQCLQCSNVLFQSGRAGGFFSTLAAGVWEAAVREKGLSINPSLRQLTRSLGFMWLRCLRCLCISRLLFVYVSL